MRAWHTLFPPYLQVPRAPLAYPPGTQGALQWASLRWSVLEETRAQLQQAVEQPAQLAWYSGVQADPRSASSCGEGLTSVLLHGPQWRDAGIKPTDLAGTHSVLLVVVLVHLLSFTL